MYGVGVIVAESQSKSPKLLSFSTYTSPSFNHCGLIYSVFQKSKVNESDIERDRAMTCEFQDRK